MEFVPLLQALGFSGPQRALIVGAIIARMAAPGSERATHRWLGERSALGELLEFDFEAIPLMAFYRATDLLMRQRWRVFRSLKSELGLRPVYHRTEGRVDGHLFICVLTYQFVQLIRRRLCEHGISDRWSTLRDILAEM